MRRVALLGWALLGAGVMVSVATAQAPVEPPSDPAGAATSAPLPASMPPPPGPVALRPKGPVRISGGVIAKNRISFVEPQEPALATLKHLSGQVLLHVLISGDGTVAKVQLVGTTNPIFNQPSMDAVKQWRYRPYLLNGEPTEVETTVTINFR